MQTYIGVDISKNDFLACFNEIDKPIKFANNNLGLSKFFNRLKTSGYVRDETIIGAESTGAYSLPLAIAGARKKYIVKIINPIVIKSYLVSSIRKVKTDKAKNVCIVAVMRKMIHVIYAVLKRQSPFVKKGA